MVTAMALIATGASAADRIRLAVQKTGTLAWELDVIRTHGLDRKAGLVLDTLELASTEAGKIALKGGSADLMLSDWLWVARERALGDNLVFSPSSSTLGAVMCRAIADTASSPISRASASLSPAAPSTRAGFCCRRWHGAPVSTSGGRPASSMALRRCCRRRRCRAKPTPR